MLGFEVDLLWRACCFRERVQQLKDNANTKLTRGMSRLELSFAPQWVVQHEVTVPIGSFLERIGLLLHQALARQDSGLIGLDIVSLPWVSAFLPNGLIETVA